MDIKHYPIPDASKYFVGTDAHVYRELKGGKMRKLKSFLVKRKDGARFYQCNITFDDGSRMTIRPSYLLTKLKRLAGDPVLGRAESLPDQDYISLEGYLWPLYYVNRHGDVYHQRKDEAGIYFHHKQYSWDDHGRANPIERINLRRYDYKPRSYTRTQLQNFHLQKTGFIPTEELQEPVPTVIDELDDSFFL